MSAIITTRTHIFNAEQIFESYGETDPTVQYLFIGKPQVWSNELIPDNPVDSQKQDFEVRRDMMSLKRILPSDVSLGLLRRNWTSGKYYDFYRHDYDGSTIFGVDIDTGSPVIPTTLYDSNFFVITDDFNVYKCIWNSNSTQSTIKPTGTSINEFTTADGYIWKYMYTVSPSDVLKFVSTDFFPVKTIKIDPGVSDFYYNQYQVQQNAVDGALSFIVINNGGSGYPVSSNSIPVSITGDGTGATALGRSNSSGQLIGVTLTAKGSNYTYANISFGGGGTGASATAIISPKYGHGANSSRELGSYYVLINVRLEYNDGGDFPTSNDYRRIGILRNPYNFGTTNVAVATTLRASKGLLLTSPTGAFAPDSIVTGATSGATGVIASYDTGTGIIYYIQTSSQTGTFVTGETINATSGGSGVISTLINPEVDVNSGELIFLEHRRAVSRDPLQIEDIKIAIEA